VAAAIVFVIAIGEDREDAEAMHPCVSPGIMGDENGDGVVTSIDALMILLAAVGRDAHSPCGRYDVDCDHDIDSVDALKVLLFAAGRPYAQVEPCPDIGKPVESPG